ncbi:hypothetical protein HYR54_12950 [Candidatus Acetothermia bacterium]|nr:hypothetical protein [Candidatus Acetothermia bacterium]
MSRGIQRQWVAGLILVGLAVGTLSFFVNAQEIEPKRQPSDYFWIEVVSGTVGALAGGFVTAIAGVAISAYLYPCTNRLDFLTCSFGQLLIAGIGFLIGAPVGAATVVIIAGSSKRVRGNILLAFTGAIAGEAVGLFILCEAIRLFPYLFSGNGILPVLTILSVVVSPALGSTLGYNIHATVEPVVLSPTSQGLVLVGLKASLSI